MLLDEFLKNVDEFFGAMEDPQCILSLISGFPGVDTAYERMLQQGAVHAFSKALRIFGLTKSENAKNILWWNKPQTWKSEYRDFFTDVWAFGEDVFGNQFLFDDTGVVWLDAETGKLRPLCHTFSKWLSLINDEPNFYTGVSLAEDWEKSYPNEPLTGMYHLCPLRLFVCGGEYEVQNLCRLGAEGHMKTMASIARQIKDLPDGTPIEITFED